MSRAIPKIATRLKALSDITSRDFSRIIRSVGMNDNEKKFLNHSDAN